MKNLNTFLKEIDYNDPRNLKDVELDRLIKKSILNINKSDWIWTLFVAKDINIVLAITVYHMLCS